MDIVNIKNQMIKKNWNISIQNDPAKNLEQFLGPDTNLSELKEACLHYQPHKKETNHLEIIICTHEQQQYSYYLYYFLPPPQNQLISSGYDIKILE
ncbi:hypothetical protein F8M41_001833 [Gigaspora margarita]|uniref:Uncharacterized protein n=1 Tax=Gigaspora margarita TaxID=4874 RepID=A0A8H4AZ34_GIGMA|nr:hypothetical protein F8M41_001833 [Gigaspora margarita]